MSSQQCWGDIGPGQAWDLQDSSSHPVEVLENLQLILELETVVHSSRQKQIQICYGVSFPSVWQSIWDNHFMRKDIFWLMISEVLSPWLCGALLIWIVLAQNIMAGASVHPHGSQKAKRGREKGQSSNMPWRIHLCWPKDLSLGLTSYRSCHFPVGPQDPVEQGFPNGPLGIVQIWTIATILPTHGLKLSWQFLCILCSTQSKITRNKFLKILN